MLEKTLLEISPFFSRALDVLIPCLLKFRLRFSPSSPLLSNHRYGFSQVAFPPSWHPLFAESHNPNTMEGGQCGKLVNDVNEI